MQNVCQGYDKLKKCNPLTLVSPKRNLPTESGKYFWSFASTLAPLVPLEKRDVFSLDIDQDAL
ncbi:hypothetical protein DPMN_097990 [Dreissena polymorpha]|uniref:Uncharacterized protein n=1 Tax=Dreissena polymorpha TaxID=45954 RepID=A0A9D4LCT0_DREPO|nr:hypothetical protein DPMN_097990 [Dreissena polymorpha]